MRKAVIKSKYTSPIYLSSFNTKHIFYTNRRLAQKISMQLNDFFILLFVATPTACGSLTWKFTELPLWLKIRDCSLILVRF